MKDLTWLVFAPNLKALEVKGCDEIQRVVGSNKYGEFAKNGQNVSPFSRLQVLILVGLPQLKSIYWKTLPLTYSNLIQVDVCPHLKNLPLNANSAKGNRIVIAGHNKRWEELEWEDETTYNVFRPCFLAIEE